MLMHSGSGPVFTNSLCILKRRSLGFVLRGLIKGIHSLTDEQFPIDYLDSLESSRCSYSPENQPASLVKPAL